MTLSSCACLRPLPSGPSLQQRERTTFAGINHGQVILAQDDDDEDDLDGEDEDENDDEEEEQS